MRVFVVDQNDVPPVFVGDSPFQADVSESAPVGESVISLRANDGDIKQKNKNVIFQK